MDAFSLGLDTSNLKGIASFNVGKKRRAKREQNFIEPGPDPKPIKEVSYNVGGAVEASGEPSNLRKRRKKGEDENGDETEAKRKRITKPWNREEMVVLDEAVQDYCKKNSIKEATLIKYLFSKELMKNEVAKEHRSGLVRYAMNKLVDRGFHSVNGFILRHYNPNKSKGGWTLEEDNMLLKLSQSGEFSNREIGFQLGRTIYDVIDRLKIITGRNGEAISYDWTEDEIQRFIDGIRTVKEILGYGPDAGDFRWKSVSNIVRTRNVGQCIRKWPIIRTLEPDLADLEIKKPLKLGSVDLLWTEKLSTTLLDRIRASQATKYTDLEWDDILKGNWCPYSASICRAFINKRIKRTDFRKIIDMPLPEFVEYMTSRIERFREKLKKKGKGNQWKSDELIRLIEAVTDLYWEADKQPTSEDIWWEPVADKVMTRTIKQCKLKWNMWLFSGRHPKYGVLVWDHTQETMLIERIRASGAKTVDGIKWDKISNAEWTKFTPELCKEHWDRRVLKHPRASELPLDQQLSWLEKQMKLRYKKGNNGACIFRDYYFGADTAKVELVREAVDEIIISRGCDAAVASSLQWGRVSKKCDIPVNLCKALWGAWLYSRSLDKGEQISWTDSMEGKLYKYINGQECSKESEIDWEKVRGNMGNIPYTADEVRDHWNRRIYAVPSLKNVPFPDRLEWFREQLIQGTSSTKTWARKDAAKLMTELTRYFLRKGKMPPLNLSGKWKKVAKHIDGHTGKECLLKWRGWVKQPVYRNGYLLRWTVITEGMFFKLVRDHVERTGVTSADQISWKAITYGNWTKYTAMELREHWYLTVALSPYVPSKKDPSKFVPVASLSLSEQLKHFVKLNKKKMKREINPDIKSPSFVENESEVELTGDKTWPNNPFDSNHGWVSGDEMDD
ncbi:Homeobox protein Nkx-2.1 [Mycoemilia scoparia]|uniref:Homeobox protein Nkx-2.1 n=1 Tax=Mycoemilia scoparia TaxID=417184 RepID=A0A9W8A5P8_9FUNG|nr:Homeobox protein Nkx-2.1 [Mycoemilia scoparia]